LLQQLFPGTSVIVAGFTEEDISPINLAALLLVAHDVSIRARRWN